MILLDTSVLSELMKRDPDPVVLAWLDAQPSHLLHISAITRAEIELGIALLPEGRRKDGLRTAADQMFNDLSERCVTFDERAASRYGTIVADRVRVGRPMSVEDAHIAATALATGFFLATRNVQDFEGIAGLTLVDPFAG